MEPNNSETAGTSNPDRSWVTLGEILKEQEELEAESDAVLGGSDEKNCTYSRVYDLQASLGLVPVNSRDELLTELYKWVL